MVAPQRILLLTLPQVVSTVRYLLGNDAAARVEESQEVHPPADSARRFPPGGDDAAISDNAVVTRDQVGQIVGQYLRENFGTVTGCAAVTDACALDFLNTLAARAYRRDPTPDERVALRNLYEELREQDINGYRITGSVEEATQYALYALVTSPQLLWRYEVGEPGGADPAGGVRLSEDELASAVSFFLTDRPPDDELLAAVRSGTLSATLDQHVARILDTPVARSWLRSVMEIYFGLNQLPAAIAVGNWTGLPVGLSNDLHTEARLFLDQILWQDELNALVESRVTFLNAGLATAIYDLPAPAGAPDTAFVTTVLPSDRRAGLLTNAGFLAASGLSGKASVGVRGQRAAAAFLCMGAPPLTSPGPALDEQTAQTATLDTQTAQQQVAARRKTECLGCHANHGCARGGPRRL